MVRVRLVIAAAGVAWLSMLSVGYAQQGSPAATVASSRPFEVQPNPKVGPWQEYPFVVKPEWTLHKELWQDFTELPDWAQRGNIVYAMPVYYWKEKSYDKIKELGYNLIHLTETGDRDDSHKQVKDAGLPLVIRVDGRLFWGRNYLDQFNTFWPGVVQGHNIPPNVEWHRKFPPSLYATRMRRDGELASNYSGQASQRSDLNLMHPAAIQMRGAFLRECLLKEQVFDLPLDRPAFGISDGIWFDNPVDPVPSYDAYSAAWIAREFGKQFGERYRQRFAKDHQGGAATRPADAGRLKAEIDDWLCDPLYFYMKYKDPDALRWWNQHWADALAGYYAWQYKFIQEEIAPKRGLKHIPVGGNFMPESFVLYLTAWSALDMMGATEAGPAKHAAGHKLALAASNGKPFVVLRDDRRVAEWLVRAEALACGGATTNPPPNYRQFMTTNRDLYHNAKPGARVAMLYHLVDGLQHDEVANIERLCDQVWDAGAPLEIITERHLSPEILRGLDVLIVPGFRLADRDVEALGAYLRNGGKLLLIGDNADASGAYLATTLAGIKAWTDEDRPVGKGRLVNFASQLVAQKPLAEALERLGAMEDCRVDEPAGGNLMVNILTQPAKGLVAIHLVNYTGKPADNVRLRLAAPARGKPLALITPHGPAMPLKSDGAFVTVPRLDVLGVVVACPDEKTRDALVARNTQDSFRPVEGGRWPRIWTANPRWRGIAQAVQKKPEDLKAGQKLAWIRQYFQADIRRLDADIVTQGQGQVGQGQEITLDIYKLGFGKSGTYFDKLAFIMVHQATGQREVVPIEMPPLTREEAAVQEAAEARETKLIAGMKSLMSQGQRYDDAQHQWVKAQMDQPLVPASTVVRRHSTVRWTPRNAGQYQVYLSYRFVDAGDQGRPDLRDQPGGPKGKWLWSDFFYGRPYLKPVFEDKLPGLIVEVGKGS